MLNCALTLIIDQVVTTEEIINTKDTINRQRYFREYNWIKKNQKASLYRFPLKKNLSS